MNVLLLLGTVLGVAGLVLAAVVTAAMGSRMRGAVLASVAAGWVALYAAAVLVASLTSHETVLPPGQTKYFCGFYLDCHIGVAVLADTLAWDIHGRRAGGTFHVLTIEVSSSARAATLKPTDLRLELVDGDGIRYARDARAEELIGGPGIRYRLNQEIPPGGSYRAMVIYDMPNDVHAPLLYANDGDGPGRAIENVLIGDEDSFLHRKTLLALPPAVGQRQLGAR